VALARGGEERRREQGCEGGEGGGTKSARVLVVMVRWRMERAERGRRAMVWLGGGNEGESVRKRKDRARGRAGRR